MKILYALLNWKRYDKLMLKSLSKLSREDLIIWTDDIERWPKFNCKQADESVAKTKNDILKYALENNYDFCFIMEDDVQIKDKVIFLEYIQLMEKFDLNVVMYGFHNNMNKVLNGRINPCMVLSVKNATPICINRFPCSALLGYRIFEDMTMFDERLTTMEHDFLLHDMCEQGNYPFNGFIFDVFNSWKKIKKIPMETLKKRNPSDIVKDKETRGIDALSLQSNGDAVINYVVEKLK